MTRQPPTPHVIARSAPLRLTGLAALVLVLTGCASLSPDGGFGEVEKATAERIGAPVQLAWARQPEDLDRIAQRVNQLLGKPLSMNDAVQVALMNNRGLQAAYAELGITEAEIVQEFLGFIAASKRGVCADVGRLHGGKTALEEAGE